MRQVERLQRVQVLQQVRVQRGIVVIVDAVDVQGAGEVEELNIPQVEQEALRSISPTRFCGVCLRIAGTFINIKDKYLKR